jgi:hypothetical protein
MSTVVDPLLSTVTLNIFKPKDTIMDTEEHFRKVSFCLRVERKFCPCVILARQICRVVVKSYKRTDRTEYFIS